MRNGFLFEYVPNFVPEFFPEIETNSWSEKSEYFLPNVEELLNEEKFEIDRHEAKLKEISNRISLNREKFKYLHDIHINTGSDLVSALVKYFKCLGFSNVVDLDHHKEDSLEEDIQIETSKGLIVIEAKGIGGTSKDSECSQISEIKHRRCKERNTFDVFALYVVNHQRDIQERWRMKSYTILT